MRKLRIPMILAALLGSLQGVLALGIAWLLKAVADLVTGEPGHMDYSVFCLAAGVYYLLYLAVYWGSRRLDQRVMEKIRTLWKHDLFAGLLWQSEGEHAKHRVGDVLSMFQQQMATLMEAHYGSLFALVKNGVVMAVTLGAILVLQWQAAFLCAALFGVYLLLTRGMNRKLAALQEASIAADAEERSRLVTLVDGYGTARDYGREAYFQGRYGDSVERSARASFRLNFCYDLLGLLGAQLAPVTTFLLLAGGGLLLEKGAGLTVGSVLALTQLASSILGPLGSMGAILARVRSVKDLKAAFAAYRDTGAEGKPGWTARAKLPELKSITLENVTFGYGEEPVLKDVSLALQAGKKYAFIGESGSGKSTLLKLLLGQLGPDSGSLYWNEIPYEEIGRGDLLQGMCYVAQEPVIFRKDILANITLGEDGSQDGDRLAAAMARSRTDTLRAGLLVRELLPLPAQELSGGEKKRVAYARALYRDSQVLILDEFTSALHQELARELEAELLSSQGPMVIHVTHSLDREMGACYDQVYRLEDGVLVLVDAPNEW